jgi:hypothetical protein
MEGHRPELTADVHNSQASNNTTVGASNASFYTSLCIELMLSIWNNTH